MPLMAEVNLEQGLPSAEQALRQLSSAIENARRQNLRVLKLIHGYGSTGSGGRLRIRIRSALRIAKENGDLKLFVAGENWRISDELAWKLLKACPEMKKDPDLGRQNAGITLVLL